MDLVDRFGTIFYSTTLAIVFYKSNVDRISFPLAHDQLRSVKWPYVIICTKRKGSDRPCPIGLGIGLCSN